MDQSGGIMADRIIKNYYTVFTDCWSFFKKYSEPVDGDEYWKAMSDEANELYIKHAKVPFSEKILSLIMGELENIWRN